MGRRSWFGLAPKVWLTIMAERVGRSDAEQAARFQRIDSQRAAIAPVETAFAGAGPRPGKNAIPNPLTVTPHPVTCQRSETTTLLPPSISKAKLRALPCRVAR